MADDAAFHVSPYGFPGAVPASKLQYWVDYLDKFRSEHPLRTAFGDDDRLLPLDPPMVNDPPAALPAPFNGPYPIKSTNPGTGSIKQEIGAGVLVGFKLIYAKDESLVWNPENWCVVYGKMGKYPAKGRRKNGGGPAHKRRCAFWAKNRNFLAGDTDLGRKCKIVAFQSILLINSLKNLSKHQVEEYVARGETRSRKLGLMEYKAQMLHLRSLQDAHLRSLPETPRQDRLAAQYNR